MKKYEEVDIYYIWMSFVFFPSGSIINL
jgi:hypothetical protein